MRPPIRIVVHLGSGPEGKERKEALQRIAAEVDAIGQRGEASISRLCQMLADGDLAAESPPPQNGRHTRVQE